MIVAEIERSEMLERKVADTRAARSKRSGDGMCVNNVEHGAAVKGGRCARCWDRKKRAERYGTECEHCHRNPSSPFLDVRHRALRRKICDQCKMLLCGECHAAHRGEHMPPDGYMVVGALIEVEGADGAWERCEVTEIAEADFAFRCLRDGAVGRHFYGKSYGLWRIRS